MVLASIWSSTLDPTIREDARRIWRAVGGGGCNSAWLRGSGAEAFFSCFVCNNDSEVVTVVDVLCGCVAMKLVSSATTVDFLLWTLAKDAALLVAIDVTGAAEATGAVGATAEGGGVTTAEDGRCFTE